MYEDFLIKRIIELRNAKNVSERDMSLSLGQSESYMNKIETGKALPSMQAFFYICEYLEVTPKDFFDDEIESPEYLKQTIQNLKKLDRKQLELIDTLIKEIKK